MRITYTGESDGLTALMDDLREHGLDFEAYLGDRFRDVDTIQMVIAFANLGAALTPTVLRVVANIKERYRAHIEIDEHDEHRYR